MRTRGQTRQMRQRASSRTTAVGRPQLTPGIHQTRSHDCAWYTCRSRCWSEFIKNFGIGFCSRAAHTPSLGDLMPLHVGPLQKETAPARGRAEAVGGCVWVGATDTGQQYNALPLAPKTPIRVSRPTAPGFPRWSSAHPYRHDTQSKETAPAEARTEAV